jgi:hypothetical protein
MLSVVRGDNCCVPRAVYLTLAVHEPKHYHDLLNIYAPPPSAQQAGQALQIDTEMMEDLHQ